MVAVADFDNQTGDEGLDGLSGMLITSLEQSRKLSVLTRSRMFDLLRRPFACKREPSCCSLDRETKALLSCVR